MAGIPASVVARRFGLSRSTIGRYVRWYRATGSFAPRLGARRVAKIAPAAYPALQAQLGAHPSATLAQHCAWWAASHGVRVSIATMARTITRLGWHRVRRPQA